MMVCKWTNCPATIDLRENGNFSLYNGMVSGSFTKIERPLKLEMNWRMKTYPANHHAKLTFSLKDTGDSTELEMLAKGVPSLLCDETKNGLQRFYAQNICRTFGFDARIL
ncbi:hypothetical protein AB6A40_005447 [Gnathostoma spinigerum]|uniref:Activator of Hsp90 ATPase homologue 1/2-like C-terminal domain-containing protein n=1 Tax=Gnathostoma spinigerum TaxID=75299 RepID=A0ABD6EFL5_9BILA